MESDEAINYWVADKSRNMNVMQCEDGGDDVEDDKPPPINPVPNNRKYQHIVGGKGKLTPVSAYDRSLAATPPSQKKQYDYDDGTNNNGYDYDNYGVGVGVGTLYRTNSEPTGYGGDEAVVGYIEESHSEPKQENVAKNKGYDMFGAQDLFANGRRNIIDNDKNIGLHSAKMVTVNKFNANSHTHSMQQGGVHRKYGPTRQPIKHQMDINQIGNKYGSISRDTSNASSMSSPSYDATTPNTKQRDR